jgi:hypothetical protein
MDGTLCQNMSDEVFCKVEWCDDDLREALREQGIEPTDKLVEDLRDRIADGVRDAMLEAGWAAMLASIDWFCKPPPRPDPRLNPEQAASAAEVIREMDDLLGKEHPDSPPASGVASKELLDELNP